MYGMSVYVWLVLLYPSLFFKLTFACNPQIPQFILRHPKHQNVKPCQHNFTVFKADKLQCMGPEGQPCSWHTLWEEGILESGPVSCLQRAFPCPAWWGSLIPLQLHICSGHGTVGRGRGLNWVRLAQMEPNSQWVTRSWTKKRTAVFESWQI